MCQRAGGREQLQHQGVCGRSSPSKGKTRGDRECADGPQKRAEGARETTHCVADVTVQMKAKQEGRIGGRLRFSSATTSTASR